MFLICIDKYFEKLIAITETKYRYFIDDIAVLTETDTCSDVTQEIVFTHRDRLGSTVAMADDLGLSVETHSFDPFGKPREGDLSDKLEAVLNSDYTTRGYTDHEHLDDVQLIHMNGRVYDYNLGRFLSVDPVIQAPGNSQSMNPYSYIMNNPLAGTDPSGYMAENETKREINVQVKRAGSRLISRETVTVSITDNGDGRQGVGFSGGSGAAQDAVRNSFAKSIHGELQSRKNVSGSGGSRRESEAESSFGELFTDTDSAIENGLQLASNGDDSELSDLLGQSGEDPALLREGDAQKKVYVDFSDLRGVDWGEGISLDDIKASALFTMQEAFPHVEFIEGSGGLWDHTVSFSSDLGPGGIYGSHRNWGIFFTRPTMKVFAGRIRQDLHPIFTYNSSGDPIAVRPFNGVEAGVAIGNYGAHELGHRFGMQHVSASGHIMTGSSIPSYQRWKWHSSNMIRAHYGR